MGWRQRKDVQSELRFLTRLYGAKRTPRLVYAAWALESAIFPAVAPSRPVTHELLDKFFAGYWHAVGRELKAELAEEPVLLESFEEDVEILVSLIQQDVLGIEPSRLGPAAGKLASQWYHEAGLELDVRNASVWAGLGLNLGYRILAAVQLLDGVPLASSRA
jgi:hypothetical protein